MRAACITAPAETALRTARGLIILQLLLRVALIHCARQTLALAGLARRNRLVERMNVELSPGNFVKLIFSSSLQTSTRVF